MSPVERCQRGEPRVPARRPAADCIAIVAAIALAGCRLSDPMPSVETELVAAAEGTPARVGRVFIPAPPPQPSAVYRPLPLIVALHGGFGTADGMAGLTHFSVLGQREQVAVLYPEGIDRRWNDGRRFEGERPGWQDDVAFIRAAVEKVCREHEIDRSRVYVCGVSNGAMMTLRLVQDCPALFAAAGIVAGCLPAAIAGTSIPPVPLLFFHGTADTYVPIGGGQIVGERGEVLSLKRTIQHVCAGRGVSVAPTFEGIADAESDDGIVTERLSWAAGSESEIVLYLLHGGGHTWPGCATTYDRLLGPTGYDVNATEALWAFFARHVKGE